MAISHSLSVISTGAAQGAAQWRDPRISLHNEPRSIRAYGIHVSHHSNSLITSRPAQEVIIALMSAAPLVTVVMGSRNDYAVMKSAVEVLEEFQVPHEARVVSAHRTPDLLFEFAEQAHARGLRIIIAGAGGAAHLPGMLAAKTTVPVLGVPIAATALQGTDALLSIVQMPRGVPVATFAIGASGAANAALFAIATLAANDSALHNKLIAWRAARRDEVLSQTLGDDPQ